RDKLVTGVQTCALPIFLGRAVAAISEHLGPYDIAVTFHHGMGCAKFMSFVGIKGGVNATEDHVGAAFACQFADFISAERVGSMEIGRASCRERVSLVVG